MNRRVELFIFILLFHFGFNRIATASQATLSINCDSLWETGKLLMDQSKMSEALEVFLEYKKCTPEDERVNGRIGFLYIELEEWSEAEMFLSQIVKEYPNDIFSLYLWGNVNRMKGDFATAVEVYDRVERESPIPLQWDFYFYYAWSVWKNGDIKKAELIFNHALTLSRKSNEYSKLSYTLVSLFINIDPEYALEVSNNAMNECETFYGLMVMHSWRATCYLNLANFDKAKEEISYATKIADDSIALPYILNAYILLADSGTIEKIEPSLLKALSISKNNEYMLYASYIFAYYGKIEKSCRFYNDYLRSKQIKKSKVEYKYLCQGKVSKGFSPEVFLPAFDLRDLVIEMEFHE